MKESYQLFDPWGDREVWRREFATGSKAFQLGEQVLAVVEPQGRFVLLNLSDGKVLVDSPIEPEPQLTDVFLLATPSRWLLFTNRFFPNHQNGISIHPLPNGFSNPLVNGLAYGFDRATGKKAWGGLPIDKQGLALEQPAELPIISLASRIYERRAPRTTSTAPFTSIVCIDTRTGRIAFQDRFEGHIGVFETVADIGKQAIELKLQNRSVRLSFTDQPVDPAAAGSADASGKKAGNDAAKPAENSQPDSPKPTESKPRP